MSHPTTTDPRSSLVQIGNTQPKTGGTLADRNKTIQRIKTMGFNIPTWNATCLGSCESRQIVPDESKPNECIIYGRDGSCHLFTRKTATDAIGCIVDEMAPLFGVAKVGTNWGLVDGKVNIFYRRTPNTTSLTNFELECKDLVRTTGQESPVKTAFFTAYIQLWTLLLLINGQSTINKGRFGVIDGAPVAYCPGTNKITEFAGHRPIPAAMVKEYFGGSTEHLSSWMRAIVDYNGGMEALSSSIYNTVMACDTRMAAQVGTIVGAIQMYAYGNYIATTITTGRPRAAAKPQPIAHSATGTTVTGTTVAVAPVPARTVVPYTAVPTGVVVRSIPTLGSPITTTRVEPARLVSVLAPVPVGTRVTEAPLRSMTVRLDRVGNDIKMTTYINGIPYIGQSYLKADTHITYHIPVRNIVGYSLAPVTGTTVADEIPIPAAPLEEGPITIPSAVPVSAAVPEPTPMATGSVIPEVRPQDNRPGVPATYDVLQRTFFPDTPPSSPRFATRPTTTAREVPVPTTTRATTTRATTTRVVRPPPSPPRPLTRIYPEPAPQPSRQFYTTTPPRRSTQFMTRRPVEEVERSLSPRPSRPPTSPEGSSRDLSPITPPRDNGDLTPGDDYDSESSYTSSSERDLSPVPQGLDDSMMSIYEQSLAEERSAIAAARTHRHESEEEGDEGEEGEDGEPTTYRGRLARSTRLNQQRQLNRGRGTLQDSRLVQRGRAQQRY